MDAAGLGLGHLRIAFSVDALTPNLTGIGRYCWELARRLPSDSRVAKLSCFRGAEWFDDPSILLHGDGERRPHRGRALRRRWDQWRLHDRFSNGLVHSPNYFLPDWAERGIATIHDLSVFKFPETHPAARIAAFEASFSSTVARARLILTDCEWIRRELIDFTGLAEDRVRAVPLGVGPEFAPRTQTSLKIPLGAFGLAPGGYGLCVSTLEPRKRIDRLLTAWRLLPRALRSRHPLVIVGSAGWQNDALMTQINQGINEGWLRYPGFVSNDDLPLLYAGARVFAYPSRYEGFGLPPLEAMASGVPTLVADNTCLTEVAGDAAMVIDPEDTPAFASAIAKALEDDAWRDIAIAAGIRQANRYTWAQCAAQTVDAYDDVARGG